MSTLVKPEHVAVPVAIPQPAESTRRWSRWIDVRQDLLLPPAAGAAALAAFSEPGERLRIALLGLCALAVGAALARRVASQAALLPLMRRLYPLLGPLLGVTALAAVELLSGKAPAGPLDLLAALSAAAAAAYASAALAGTPAAGSVRVALIGPPGAAERLARALEAGGSPQYELVGRVRCGDEPDGPGPPALGALGGLAELVCEHRIDLLVMAAEAPRLEVFGEIADSCLELPVRLVELSALFEEVFGHVPTAEINACWFQCLAEPKARVSTGAVKRAIDITGAAVMMLVALPLLAVLVVLIRRDGGPALFTQVRIGEGGRSFPLHKLRTMRVGADASAQWARPDDPRTTGIGAFLRRTHLDELPQLANVLRGEMSLVGPRPEQPEFVDRLERTLPFYQRRHLMRPGITGWAQIRCGYAGSDIGSAWKLCHDLYYAKHRSVGVDLLILCETLATLFFEREPVIRPESVAFVLAHER